MRRDDEFLELGLLLIVTGFMVGILILSLVIVLMRGARVESPPSLALASAGALFALLVVVFFLVRRVLRFVARR